MGNRSSQQSTIGGEAYERLRVLGKGSFGKVYAVEHVNSGVVRVVKEMTKADLVEKGLATIKATSAEREIFARLNGCPYVCKVFAATQDEARLFLLLEYCPGGELEYHRAQRGFFAEEDVKLYVAMLAYGLDQMHRKYHVIHRDLKPENVLLTAAGYCRIIDLNIAHMCDGEDCKVANESKSTYGTMPYIGVRKKAMLSGIEATTAKAQFKKNAKEWAELEHGKKAPSLSEDFIDIVSKLLELDPKKRLDFAGVREHSWFKDFDWKAIESQSLPRVPIIPVNCANDANVEDIFGMDKHSKRTLTSEDQSHFANWDWVAADQEVPKGSTGSGKTKKKGKKETYPRHH